MNFIHLRTKDFNETKISLPNIEKPITFNLDSTIRRPNLYKSSSLVNLPYNSRKKFPLFEDTKDKQVKKLYEDILYKKTYKAQINIASQVNQV